jgi:Skp family chaperone for outer membrane proteins
MKKIVLSIVILCSAIVTFAQGKTAYISTDDVFANIPQVKIADSAIMKENTRLSALYKEREEELNDMISLFVKDSGTMDKDVKELKREKLQKKVTDLQTGKRELEDELAAYKEKVYAPIKDKVFAAIKDFIKVKGITTVLYRENAVIIPAGTDITRDIILKLGGKLK